VRKILYSILCLTLLHIFLTEARAFQLYEIKKGDTLYRIAKNYGVSVGEIRRVNNLPGSNIYAGDALKIPLQSMDVGNARSNPARHIVKRGENLYRLSLRYGLSVDDLKDLNNLPGDIIKVGQALLVPSVYDIFIDDRETGGLAQENGRLAIIKEAMEYIGVPYKFGGSSLKGIDCSALVQKVFGYFSIDLPRTAREQFRTGVRIRKNELRIGDLIFFRTYAKFPSHVGIYMGGGKMIHASSRYNKVTVSSIYEPFYVRRYIGSIRLHSEPSRTSASGIESPAVVNEL
jgi:peptidoglycan DL-endopeptidase LytE